MTIAHIYNGELGFDVRTKLNALIDQSNSLPVVIGTGDVVGPGSAIADNLAVFDGVTGKLIKDGGQTIAEVIAAAGGGGGGGGMPPYVFLSCNVVEDNALAGAVVGTLSVIGLSGFSFSLIYDPSGRFVVSGANLETSVNLSAADDGTKPVAIRAYDGVTRYDYGYVILVIPPVTIPYSPTYYVYGF